MVGVGLTLKNLVFVVAGILVLFVGLFFFSFPTNAVSSSTFVVVGDESSVSDMKKDSSAKPDYETCPVFVSFLFFGWDKRAGLEVDDNFQKTRLLSNIRAIRLQLGSLFMHNFCLKVRLYSDDDSKLAEFKSRDVEVIRSNVKPSSVSALEILQEDWKKYHKPAIWVEFDTVVLVDLADAYSKETFLVVDADGKVSERLWMIKNEHVKSHCANAQALSNCLATVRKSLSHISMLNDIYPGKTWGREGTRELSLDSSGSLVFGKEHLGSLVEASHADVEKDIGELFQRMASFAPRKNHRVLITGIAGFIGVHTALALKKRGDFVIGVDNFDPSYHILLVRNRAEVLRRASIQVDELSIHDLDAMVSLLRDNNITAVIHLAKPGRMQRSAKDPLNFVREHMDCSSSIFEAVRVANPLIHIVYASSSDVYGVDGSAPFAESAALRGSSSDAGFSKISLERLALFYHNTYKIKSTGLRLFTVYGRWGRPDAGYYFQYADQLRRNETVTLFKQQGEFVKRDFLHVDDVVHGIVRALERSRGNGCEWINLGRGVAESLYHVVKNLTNLLHVDNGKVVVVNELPPSEAHVSVADISRAKKILDFEPRVTLEQGLRDFVAWYLSYEQAHLQGMFMSTLFTHGKNYIPGERKLETYGAKFIAQVKEFKIPTLLFLNGYGEEELAFIKEHSSPYLTFVPAKLDPERSLNDERFHIYKDYLDQMAVKPRFIMFSDSRDVQFSKNPFPFLKELSPKFPVVGQKEGARAICGFIYGRLHECNIWNEGFNFWVTACEIYNSGLWGGRFAEAYSVLRDSVDILTSDRIIKSQNCNMAVHNIAIRRTEFPVYSEVGPLFAPFRICSPLDKHILHHKSRSFCGRRAYFIDLGGHDGGSLRFSTKKLGCMSSLEIHVFECNPSMHGYFEKGKLPSGLGVTHFHPECAWIDDKGVELRIMSNNSTCTIRKDFPGKQESVVKVPSLDLSAWMKGRFYKEDLVVLNMDIVGAELDLLPKMERDGTLELIDVFYGDFYGERLEPKISNKGLQDILNMHNITNNIWSAGRNSPNFVNFCPKIYEVDEVDEEP